MNITAITSTKTKSPARKRIATTYIKVAQSDAYNKPNVQVWTGKKSIYSEKTYPNGTDNQPHELVELCWK